MTFSTHTLSVSLTNEAVNSISQMDHGDGTIEPSELSRAKANVQQCHVQPRRRRREG